MNKNKFNKDGLLISKKKEQLNLSKRTPNQRILILDTNVILFDASAITKFKKVDIYIPLAVIEEIDQFKRDPGQNGRNARQFSRFCDTLRLRGPLNQGVEIKETKSFVYVITPSEAHSIPPDFLRNHKENGYKVDNRILHLALTLQNAFPKHKVELITKDINLRIKADVFGVTASDYEPEKISSTDLYKGFSEFKIFPSVFQSFYDNKILELQKFKKNSSSDSKDKKLFANQYVIFKDIADPKRSALGRFVKSKQAFVLLSSFPQGILGIYPRNIEQSFAMDSLSNDDISFVSLVGKAGTGKTLLALAVGLNKILRERRFKRLLISRPIFPMGRDIGYLPGDLEQKLNPWMQPIFDNIELLMGSDTKAHEKTNELLQQGIVNIEPLTYIRGRSIPNQFFIVDEAQNLTPHEIKTIITRAGQGTKIVLTGDPSQIDSPYLDLSNSGLTHSIERFKEEELGAHVSLSRGERSKLAELAANLL